MSLIPAYASYAGAFEKAFVSDDWSLVEPFFTEGAVYTVGLDPPMGGRFEGRAAILSYFKDVLDRFDRRFESREVSLLDGPKQDSDSVWIRGGAIYRGKGVPDLAFELEEAATFDGERICRLEDTYELPVRQHLTAYLKAYGRKLGISTEA